MESGRAMGATAGLMHMMAESRGVRYELLRSLPNGRSVFPQGAVQIGEWSESQL